MSLLFTVIIPTYNRAGTIGQTIRSVLRQTYSNFEIIVVDDGSQDNTSLIVQEIKDQRIRYLFQSNRGVCTARNFGFLHASGKFVAFLDSDDTVSENWLMDFVEGHKLNPSSNVMLCGIKYFRNGRVFKELNDSERAYLAGAFVISSELFRMSGGYDETLRFGENTELFIRISQFSPLTSKVPNHNLNYFQSMDGGSKNLINKVVSNEKILRKHVEFYKKNKRGKRLLSQVIGVGYLKLGNYSKAREYFWTAFMLNPFYTKNLIRYLLSFFPYFVKRFYS